MARGVFHKVGGTQGKEAEKHGLVKVDRSTAGRFFDAGMPVIVSGSRVDPAHLLKGHQLAIVVTGGQSTSPKRLGGSSEAGLVLRSTQTIRDFDAFMRGIDRQMATNPLGPHAVTFVFARDYPRLPRGRNC